jgi:tetratricopeptide (TPR) repeat protein
MSTSWKSRLQDKTGQGFIGRSQELTFFTSLLSSDEPEYSIIYVSGVGGVGKTTLLNRYDAKAKEKGAISARVNENQRSVPEILEEFYNDLLEQGAKMETFSKAHHLFRTLQSELHNDPEFAVAMLENSGRVFASSSIYPDNRSSIIKLQGAFSQSDISSTGIPENIDDELRSLQIQLSRTEESLLLLQEQKTLHVFSEDVPLQFIRNERELTERIAKLKNRINELLSQASLPSTQLNHQADTRKPPLLGMHNINSRNDDFQFLEYLHRKFADPQSRELILNTEHVLTQAFFSDLSQIILHQRVLLIFDTYEVLSSFADAWLRDDFLEHNLDRLNFNLILLLAGRTHLPTNWHTYLPITRRIELQPFSDEESREFILNRGISDTSKITALQHISGNLPLMLAFLSTEADLKIDELSVTQSIIAHFLKWIPQQDSIKREALILCAFPRILNQDIVAHLFPQVATGELFDWLCSFSFLSGYTGVWRYHSIVRQLIMQYQFDQSPDRYNEIHEKIARYYESCMTQGESHRQQIRSSFEARSDRRPNQVLELEFLYHKLCQNQGFDLFLARFLETFRLSSHAQELVNTFMEAAEDAKNKSMFQEWYDLFTQVPQCRSAIDCALPEWSPLFERMAEYAVFPDLRLEAFVHYELGYFYTAQKRYLRAEQAYQQAIALRPDYVSAYNGLGTVYRLTERLEEAEQFYRQCIEIAPEYIFPYYNLARLMHSMQRDDEAEAFYHRAIDLRPALPFSYYNFGNFLRKVGRYTEAVERYRQAIEMDPHHVSSYINQGLVLEELGNESQARSTYMQALAIDPDNYLSHLNLGILTARLANVDEAITHFRRCMEIEPEQPGAYIQLAQLLEATGREREALAVYRQLSERQPENASVCYIIADLCEQLERYEEALEWLETYLRLEPEDHDAREHRATLQAYIQQQDST